MVALSLAFAVPAAAEARTLVVQGAGFGHGVGMSQYGAFGFAKRGTGYVDILKHYYTGTALGKMEPKEVTVLLGAGRKSVRVTGAERVGDVDLSADRTYVVTPRLAGVAIKQSDGTAVTTSDVPIRFDPGTGRTFTYAGKRYRGRLEVRSSFGGVSAINAVGMEDYLRGVVPEESPPSWPADALRAQAVAARTYALVSDKGTTTDGFEHYDDTRSQVYEGAGAEVASTDAAIRDTRGEIVTYAGKPVTTYFFSTSGGRTENVENSFIGSTPQPYLKSVQDPYDSESPRHRWRLTFTAGQAKRRLGSFVRGSFRSIKVLKRGRSPRVIRAQVVGTGGTVAVTGPELRARLGLFDTWATFKITP